MKRAVFKIEFDLPSRIKHSDARAEVHNALMYYSLSAERRGGIDFRFVRIEVKKGGVKPPKPY